MKRARLILTIKPDVLDPAGVAIKHALHRQGLSHVREVRVGRVVDISFSDGPKSTGSIEEQDLSEALAFLQNDLIEDLQIEQHDET